ncbi:hypothetical protein [Pararhizobium haloflavum]|uniref:hypothetical protein n=1 Tax=Pararhizobium haloflavum TaxID=2037914 RepID=UPI0012FFE22A|nr:hypothetical protein [Pararhizobium haloflavum]
MTDSPATPFMKSIALLFIAVTASGCASGYVTGGVASASASNGRVEIDSRTGRAEIGPGGARATTDRSSTALCVDPATGVAVVC